MKNIKLLPVLVLIAVIFFPAKINAQTMPDNNFCNIRAEIVNNDSACLVMAKQPFEYIYDDGSYEDFVVWTEPGNIAAVKFFSYSPSGLVRGGEINVGDGSFPAGSDFLGHDIRIIVYNDHGEGGLPGEALDSVDVTVNNYNWVKFDGLNAYFENGIFYLATKQLNPPLNAAPVGVDNQYPLVNQSYIKPVNGNWQISPYQDFMIRATVCDTNLSKYKTLKQNDTTWYELSRISGFNPENGETPEDGTATVIDTSLIFSYYTDTALYALSSGYYAYGIRILYGDSATSRYYSNAVYHNYTSIKENGDNQTNVSVYPNPVKDKLNIKSKTEIFSVKISNINGVNIFSAPVHNKTLTVPTGNLTKGFYFIEIYTENGKTRKTFVKE